MAPLLQQIFAVGDATLRLLQREPQITARIGCNDQIALAIMNSAHDLGLNVPNDLSVVGFNNIELAAEVRPALTTVAVDKVLLGVKSVCQPGLSIDQDGGRNAIDSAYFRERAEITKNPTTDHLPGSRETHL